MAQSTQVVISYGTSSSVTLPIPSNSDFSTAVLNISRGGGFLFVDSAGIPTWVPVSQVTKITAQ